MTSPGSNPFAIDYYFSVLSDWAYFGGDRLEALARRLGVRINYMPMKLAKIYEATGGILLQKRSKERQDYRVVELERWRDFLGLPITIHPRFYPVDDALSSCAIIASLASSSDTGRLVNLIHRAIWVEEKDISCPAVLAPILQVVGMDPDSTLRAARSREILEQLELNTQQAISRGVFGSPFYCLRDEIFWGQDRLEFLERSLVRLINSNGIPLEHVSSTG